MAGSDGRMPGEELRLRYRILVHPATVDIAAAFTEYARAMSRETVDVSGPSLRASVTIAAGSVCRQDDVLTRMPE